MATSLIVLFFAIFGLSWLTARAAGRSWSDSKVIEGWPGEIVSCSAFISALGFTWCYWTPLAMLAYAMGWMSGNYLEAELFLAWPIAIIVIDSVGLGLWMNSLMDRWRWGDIARDLQGAWETYTEYHSRYEVIRFLPHIYEQLRRAVNGEVSKNKLVIFSAYIPMSIFLLLFAGPLTTTWIIRDSAKKHARRFACDIRGVSC